MEAFSCRVSGHAITCTGEFDAAAVATFKARLSSLGDVDVTVDLAGITFIDSSALHALIAAHQALADAGRTLVIVEPAPVVRRILEITDLADVLEAPPHADSRDGSDQSD